MKVTISMAIINEVLTRRELPWEPLPLPLVPYPDPTRTGNRSRSGSRGRIEKRFARFHRRVVARKKVVVEEGLVEEAMAMRLVGVVRVVAWVLVGGSHGARHADNRGRGGTTLVDHSPWTQWGW